MDLRTDRWKNRQLDSQAVCWMLCLAMGLTRGQFQLLTPLWLLLTCVQPRMGLEHISYAPQLSSAALAGKLTQSTFTLEQPLGQFDQPSISDFDPIWLVVAHSNATQNFVAPRKAEDIPVPASFAQRGYYFTLVADRQRYPSSQGSSQLRVLRVGNDTRCPLTKRGCNSPLLGPGPYRVKFLVMKDSGPAAETDWSPEIRLQQAREVQGVQGLHSAGSVVLIAFLSVLLAILLAALLLLLIHTCFDSCRSTHISSPRQSVNLQRYSTHHMCGPPAEGGS